MNINFDLLKGIYQFILDMFNSFVKLWNTEIDTGVLGDLFGIPSFKFSEIATTLLIIVVVALLINKLIR